MSDRTRLFSPKSFNLKVFPLILASLVCTSGIAAADETDPSSQVLLGDDNFPNDGVAGKKLLEKQIEYGMFFRLNTIHLPTSMFEWFLEYAPGGIHSYGLGLGFVRRRGDFEIALDLGWDSLKGTDGTWIDNNGVADEVEYDGLGWVSLEFVLAWRFELSKHFAFRMGTGLGGGVIIGDLLQTDQTCTVRNDPSTCQTIPGAQPKSNEDIPPIVPLVRGFVGTQVTYERFFWNVEAGMRTLFYFGTNFGVNF